MANFLEDDLSGTATQGLDTDNLDPEVGDANSWVQVTVNGGGLLSDLTINGAGTGVFCTAGNGACYNSTTPPSENYAVVATILDGGSSDIGKAGVFMRHPTGENASRYQVEWDNSANEVAIRKIDLNNSYTTLGSTYSYSGPGTGLTFELKGSVSGTTTTTIKAYVNGAEVLSYDDSSSPITAAGRCGLSIRGGSDGSTQILNVTAGELTGDADEALTGSAFTAAQTTPAVSTTVAL